MMGKPTKQVVSMRNELREVAANRDKWKQSSERNYSSYRQEELKVAELERINRDYERDLQHDTEMALKAQERIWDTTDSIGRALRIIDKLTEGGK